MSLESAIAEYPVEWSHTEVLSALQARTVTVRKTVWGADVQDVLSQAGIVGFLKETAEAPGNYSPFKDLCIQLMNRFGAGGEIDFTRPSVEAGLLLAMQHPTIVGLIEASAYGTTAAFEAAVLAVGSTTAEEFPGVRLMDVIAVREPALKVPTTSFPVIGRGRAYIVTLGAVPEPITPLVEVRHHVTVDNDTFDTEWRGSGLAGFAAVTEGVYRILLPAEWTSVSFSVRVTVPYATFLSIENG